jgi:glutaredoxin
MLLPTHSSPCRTLLRLDQVEDGSDIQAILAAEISNQSTVPQIFINQVSTRR